MLVMDKNSSSFLSGVNDKEKKFNALTAARKAFLRKTRRKKWSPYNVFLTNLSLSQNLSISLRKNLM
jgi:hypothetical protein